MDATAENATRTTAGFYCYMVVPPIQRILDILLDTLFVGGCRPPLIRELAEQADVARGAVTDLLRQLATDGWISYDGRTITLLRDGSEVDDLIDQVIDQPCDSDRSGDRSRADVDRSPDRSESAQIVETAVQRSGAPQTPDRDLDRSRDRSDSPPRPPMVHVNNKQQVVVAVSDSGGVRGGDHAPPAAHLLAELGADPKIIASALRKRPDLMPEQVRATWQYCQQRIAESNGKLNSGIFFHAMKQGQIHAAPPDPDRPIPVEDYAQQPGYTRGSDTAPQTDAEKQATAYADAHWRAVDLLGKGAPFREMAIIVEALVAGDSDAAALAALEAHRKRVAR